MRIFLDESGTFSGSSDKSSVSAVGALIIPDQQFPGFEKLYGRLRNKLPVHNGEVKGRLLDESQVSEVVKVLHKLGCLFEIVVVDSVVHSEKDLEIHRKSQAEKLTANLTEKHQKSLVDEVWALRKQLEGMSTQLYIQSCALSELVYNVLFHANLYYAFRLPKELGEYNWVIDAKDRDKVTSWENWWSTVVLSMIESKSFRKPFIAAEGGNYRWHEKFKTDLDDYKKQFVRDPDKGSWFNLNPILQDNIRFSSQPEFGLEAVDILTNAVRRSMAGNFSRDGWLPIRELMVHTNRHYIRMISLASEDAALPKVSYLNVLDDFTKGGRALLPPGY
ncbi:hypothetical protein [Mesorhizobium sp.]|uniref:hypothetical protein n=1 Tax=Mesorhizobium sp. TaxID=1871066 RepID=UPI0011F7D3AD|nr:hypothetical protein [Mesorhizobium sp.]TIS46178.1 MAG: hypothetical protein E5W96_27755 [Mesorhizobium sp.]